MQIKINQKFRLISHNLGSCFLILNTSYFVKIFPGLLYFKDLHSSDSFKIFLRFQGPVKNFTILQNLISGHIEVNFHSQEGYFAYKIFVKEKNVYLYFDRLSKKAIEIEFGKQKKVCSKEKVKLPIKVISRARPEEHIFFGVHKKQDLESIKKRGDLQEIIPFIFLCSQFYLDFKYSCDLGKKDLLKKVYEEVQKKEKQMVFETLLNIFKVHFFGAFIPRINDEDYQNIVDFIEKKLNPLCVFTRLFSIIKSLFIDYHSNEISILPCLPSSFHHGRAINMKTLIGIFDIEWSKKILKKLIFKPAKDINLKLVLQSKIKTFRVRTNKKEIGKFFKNKDEISFKRDKIYFLDKFQK